MNQKKDRREDRDFDNKRGRRENHLAEKHFKNAFRSKSFSVDSLSEEDLDELGFEDDQYR